MEYKSINNMTWEQILREPDLTYPRSVSMQIQPLNSQYFMHIDPSFNIHARSVYPDTPEVGEKSWKFLGEKYIYELDFAFDSYAKIFNQNRSRFHRIDNFSPVIVGTYFADGLNYEFKYFTTQTEKYVQDITSVEITITNNLPKTKGNGLIQPNCDGRIPKAPNSRFAHLYMKPRFTKDATGHNDNYVPFRFNNKLWSYDDNLELVGTNLKFKNGNIFGNILDTDMEYSLVHKEYKNIQELMDKDQGHIHPTDLYIDYPYRDQILEKLVNVLCFTKEIAPGETCYIKLNLLSNRLDNSENSLNALSKTYSYENTIKEFNKFRENKTELKCASLDLENIYKACQNAIGQLIVDFKEKDYFLPTQGGINDRFYCWIWEAMSMIEPITKMGYTDIIKESIKFMFSLQDSGVKPDGEFSDFEGAIGSTGPRWICTTGSAINAASLYLTYTKDKDFEIEFLPKMKKGVDWILRQTNNTKIIENGKKSPYYGLLPRGTANDGDYCYNFGFSDLFSFVGVGAFVDTLKNINHPDYEKYHTLCEEYRENIINAIKLVAKPNGKVPKYVPSDKDSFYEGFEDTANYLFSQNVLSPNDPIMIKFAEFVENESSKDEFLQIANEEESYMGTQEYSMQYHYLYTHQYKKAYMTLMANIKYGMSKDTYQVLERYSKYEEFWCPWQPNGSGSGRMLEMINRSIYFETENEIILFGGLPPVFLKENKITELKNLLLPNGKVSIKAVYEDNKIKVSISGDYDKKKKIILQSDEFELKG